MEHWLFSQASLENIHLPWINPLTVDIIAWLDFVHNTSVFFVNFF
jgi:hypothetical protein